MNTLPDDNCIAKVIKTQIEEDDPMTESNRTSDKENQHVSNEEDLKEEMNLGPEQGGAAGDCNHPDAPPVIEEFLFTSPDKPPGDETEPCDDVVIRELLESASKKARESENNIVEMPAVGRKLNDYSEPFIQSMVFPCFSPMVLVVLLDKIA